MPHPFLAPPRILFASSEVYPLSKTGGLADVSSALPAALRHIGVDCRVLMPGYRNVLQSAGEYTEVANLEALNLSVKVRLLRTELPDSTPLYIADCPAFYQRGGGPYQDARGEDWPDNAERFALLSWLAALLASAHSPIGWRPDILHCNDWQTGLAPAYSHFMHGNATPTVMTIHNLAYQGIFPANLLERLGLPQKSFDIDGLEYYGQLSFLKAGLHYADKITTVSPTYAREIQTEPLGMGMQGLLSQRSRDVLGILNGIDMSAWNPASDTHLPASYDAETLAGKRVCKISLQQELGLAAEPDKPLLGVVSRLTHQKGLDLLLPIVPRLIEGGATLAVLGSGEAALETAFRKLAARYPGRAATVIGYDEGLAHRVEAGIDIFLMPSRFEPCGLNQMYSQRYGTPPVVHATGGLADSVIDTDPRRLSGSSATGFVFRDLTSQALLVAILRAQVLYYKKSAWEMIMKNGMREDFGWESSARQYLDLYEGVRTKR
jgi:starch synthase